MQVKKFEARTMKEALEMVKVQLGPEAIILSARDNHRSFGLVGEGSVEITAAISEESLQRHRFAQSKLREQDREKFDKSPARVQKALIEQFVQNHTSKNQFRPITTRRYIEIEEDESIESQNRQNYELLSQDKSQQLSNQIENTTLQATAQMRIKDAAQRAWQAMNFTGKTTQESTNSSSAEPVKSDTSEIVALKNEISGLKKMLGQFQNVPQTFSTQQQGLNFNMSSDFNFIFEKLKSEGVENSEIIELIEMAQAAIPQQHQKNKALIEGFIARKMMDKTMVTQHDSESKFHFFFGPSGSGKTSALVKMASHKVVSENKKVALITTDTYKVGAADQLRIFAQILNVPFAVVRQSQDWVKLKSHFENIDHIFVDFPGFSLKSSDEIVNLESLIPAMFKDVTKHLSLSALGKFEDLNSIATRYKQIGIDDLIINSIDQSVQFGNIYTLMNRLKIPLHSFGMGPKLPEDFEYATKERLLDLIFKITSNQTSNNQTAGEIR